MIEEEICVVQGTRLVRTEEKVTLISYPDYLATVSTNVILADLEQLAELLIDYDVGVTKEPTHGIKLVDSDYSEE